MSNSLLIFIHSHKSIIIRLDFPIAYFVMRMYIISLNQRTNRMKTTFLFFSSVEYIIHSQSFSVNYNIFFLIIIKNHIFWPCFAIGNRENHPANLITSLYICRITYKYSMYSGTSITGSSISRIFDNEKEFHASSFCISIWIYGTHFLDNSKFVNSDKSKLFVSVYDLYYSNYSNYLK